MLRPLILFAGLAGVAMVLLKRSKRAEAPNDYFPEPERDKPAENLERVDQAVAARDADRGW
jgi:hypothetical protein